MRLKTVNFQTPIWHSIQGEGGLVGMPSTFLRLWGCNQSCEWCFHPDTPVLMEDLTWKPISDIRIGDRVVCGERGSKYTQPSVTTVMGVLRKEAPLSRVLASTGQEILCTSDHKFWKSKRSCWSEVRNLVGHEVHFLAPPVEYTEEFWRGWLAGVADGDGCFWTLKTKGKLPYRRFRLAVDAKDVAILHKFKDVTYRLFHIESRLGMHHTTASESPIQHKETWMPCLWVTKNEDALWLEDAIHADKTLDWMRGYLSGMVDTDGTVLRNNASVTITQAKAANPDNWDCIRCCLDTLEFRYTEGPMGFYLRGGQAWRFSTMCRTVLERKRCARWSLRMNGDAKISSVTETGVVGPVVTLTTDAGNYIAAGFLVKNCDTKGSWQSPLYDEVTVQSVAQVLNEKCLDHIVITGGNPLVQRETLVALIRTCEAFRHKHVTIETNAYGIDGGGIPALLYAKGSSLLWSLSPKLHDFDHDIVTKFMLDDQGCDLRVQMKIVVANTTEARKAADIFRYYTQKGLPVPFIPILQPEYSAGAGARQAAVAAALESAAMGYPLQVIPQVHKLLSVL